MSWRVSRKRAISWDRGSVWLRGVGDRVGDWLIRWDAASLGVSLPVSSRVSWRCTERVSWRFVLGVSLSTRWKLLSVVSAGGVAASRKRRARTCNGRLGVCGVLVAARRELLRRCDVGGESKTAGQSTKAAVGAATGVLAATGEGGWLAVGCWEQGSGGRPLDLHRE